MTPEQLKLFRRAVWKLFGFEPHVKQEEILDHRARKKVGYAGRKGGKTTAMRAWLRERILLPRAYGRIACISISYKHTRLAFDPLVLELKQQKIPILIDHSRTDPGYIRIKNFGGGISDLFCRSTEDPDSLLGDKYDAGIDEAARIPDKVYYGHLAQQIQQGFFATTPKGHTYVSDLFFQGQDPQYQDEVFSVSFDTFSNTKMPPEDYEALKKEYELARKYSPLLAEQEYMAREVAGVDDFFHNIESNIDESLALGENHVICEPDPLRFYSMGVDLARFRDHTVITILDDLGKMVYWHKVGRFDWNLQKNMIIHPAEKYQAIVCPDATGQGQPIVEELAGRLPVIGFRQNDEGFLFQERSRSELLTNLNIMLTDARLRFPKISDLLSALVKTSIGQTEAGRIKIGDSAGHLPDEVASLALACWGLRGLPSRYDRGKTPESYTPIHQPEISPNGLPIYEKQEEEYAWPDR